MHKCKWSHLNNLCEAVLREDKIIKTNSKNHNKNKEIKQNKTKLGLFHQKRGGNERLKPSPIACGLHKNNTGNQMKRQAPPGKKKISLGFQTSHKTSIISDKPASQEPTGIFAFDYFGMIWQQMAMEGRTGRLGEERQERPSWKPGRRGSAEQL